MDARTIARFTFLIGVILVPRLLSAQSSTTGAIAGSVKDATGAVLPGVAVEASSPALIERARTAVTDDQGNFKIVDLRPGTYTVTLALTGFSPVKREGIELTAGFTATINGDLKVGPLEETITVTQVTPVVDLQNSRTQQVLKSDVMDALPTGTKNFMQFGALTLGGMASQAGSQNDVGGDKGEQSTGIMLHGGRGDDSKANWDGMNTNVFFGNGGGQNRTYYFNTVAVQEVVVDTGGNTAESETGGANLNLVPKEGSNTYRAYATANFTDNRFSATAISADDAARGLSPQSSLKLIDDYGFGVGGPIMRNKLWFYTASRWWNTENYGAGNYFNKSTNPYAYVPDTSRPAYADTFFRDNSLRLTWQPAAKHKISQEEHVEYGCSCWLAIGRGALAAPEATTDYQYGPQVLSQTTWTFAATNRLLIEAGATFLRQRVSFVNGVALSANKFTARGTPAFPGPATFSINELTTGYTWGALPGSAQNYSYPDDNDNFNQRFAVSYVTGSHAFKAGGQLLEGHYDYNGMQVPNQVTYSFRNGAPASLTEWAGPFLSLMRLSSTGLYAQDQWTMNRLTVNLGVRFDRFAGHTLAFTTPSGPFITARTVPEIDNLPNYKDITPRLGASFDLFGNGKTAIKFAFGKYLFGQGGGLSQLVAPSTAIVQNVTRTWNDANSNFVPDCVLTNPGVNGECGAISNSAFGQPINNITIADDARQGWGHREYNYQTNVQLQHEIRPGMSIAIGYFHTQWGNLQVQQNTATAPSDYSQYCITAPTDARLGPVGGTQVCGLYDVNPNKFGQVNQVITLASNFGTPKEVYNGVDMAFNARWGHGALLQGGVALGRETFDYCYANGRPDLTPENFPGTSAAFVTSVNYPRSAAYCHIVSSWWDGIGSQIKLQGVYPLPWGFQAAGTYKNIPGVPITANYVATNTLIAPSLGRNLAACPAEGICTATPIDALLPSGQNTVTTAGALLYDRRLNETDLRITRSFHVGRGRMLPTLDLYNVFNSRVPQVNNTTYGAVWLKPSQILGGRLLKFGVQFDF